MDTPVRVQIQWNPTPQNNSGIFLREETNICLKIYKSILFINPISFSDAGFYTCIAEIEPEDNVDAVIGVLRATEGININICKESYYAVNYQLLAISFAVLNVSILVDYTPPPDFNLPSPPYYRPASSVSLTCLALPDAVSPLTYHWSSTCSSCNVSDYRSRHITIDILKSSDAGIHTCTVTDAEGHSGSAETQMRLYGMTPAIHTHFHLRKTLRLSFSPSLFCRGWSTYFF